MCLAIAIVDDESDALLCLRKEGAKEVDLIKQGKLEQASTASLAAIFRQTTGLEWPDTLANAPTSSFYIPQASMQVHCFVLNGKQARELDLTHKPGLLLWLPLCLHTFREAAQELGMKPSFPLKMARHKLTLTEYDPIADAYSYEFRPPLPPDRM